MFQPGIGRLYHELIWMPSLPTPLDLYSTSATVDAWVDVYTVPTGKVAWFPGTAFAKRGTTNTTTFHWGIKHSGSYYRATNSFVTGADESNLSFVLEEGDSLAFYATTYQMEWVQARAYEYVAGDCPVKSAYNYALVSGTNSLYTVPEGKVAFIASVVNPNFPYWPPLTMGILASNNSDYSAAYRVKYKPSGSSSYYHVIGSDTSVITMNASLIGGSSVPHMLVEGDEIGIYTSTNYSGQAAWLLLFERDPR